MAIDVFTLFREKQEWQWLMSNIKLEMQRLSNQ
jgi:hypothetical protein